MTVYNLNLPIYRNFIERLFPKMEDRNYCKILRQAYHDCSRKNYEEHEPCLQLKQMIQKLECLSLEPRPLHPVKTKSQYM
jgi:hypothetical protein